MLEQSIEDYPPHYQHSLKIVSQGESFFFHPLLTQELEQIMDEVIVDYKPFEVEGIGSGRIDLSLLNVDVEIGGVQRMPAGEVRPAKFNVRLFQLDIHMARRVRCLMSYGESEYEGQANLGMGHISEHDMGDVYFDRWITPADKEDFTVLFPPSVPVLSDVEFRFEIAGEPVRDL